VKCKACGASLDATRGGCPSCGAAVELGRLTGILGVVCRACDSYNEPGAKLCGACGAALGRGESPAAASAPAAPGLPPAPGAALPASGPGACHGRDATRGPIIRSLGKAGSGEATRFVPAASLRSSPAASRPRSPGAPGPVPPTCPRCGAPAGVGRFCARCGQALEGGVTSLDVNLPPRPAFVTRIGALAPGRVRLVLEGDAGGASFPLDAERVEVGRTRGAVVFPEDPFLAPHHATFSFRGGALHLRDEGAPGGVFLRLRAHPVPLRTGDHFAVGERLLRYAGLVPPPDEPPPDGTRRLGSPRPPGHAVVIEESLEGGRTGRVFVRAGPSVTIGRAGCAVSLADDPRVSQAHAKIRVDVAGDARLEDLGSSNGTFLKIPPHGERELREGDLVRLGLAVLRVAAG
jgi:pSer/pThr/pTyr-binding forkhead associated (FHA) protein